jgi:lipopolysaccharide biosynthesis glycosyltransferase
MIIVVCLNKGYLMPTTVMLCSLFENNKGEQICVHALLGEGGEMCISPLKALAEKYSQVIECHLVDKQTQPDLPVKGKGQENHLTIEAYFRLFLCDYLPEDIDKVLYLDGDMIICQNIRELWECELGESAVGVVPCFRAFDVHYTNSLRYDVRCGYFNSGVMLINLKLWREECVKDTFLAYIRNCNHPLIYCDQDVLNAVFYNKKKELPIKFNLSTSLLYKEKFHSISCSYYHEIKEAFNDPVIIHYVGPYKPWFSNSHTPLKNYFEKYFKIMGYKGSGQRYRVGIRKRLWQYILCIKYRVPYFEYIFYDECYL